MNTALLSARKRTHTGELRGNLLLSGRSVLAWQVALAQSLNCTRIICLCDAPTPEILEIQRRFEADGGEFHAVRSSLQLVALLRSHDTLVMMLDGLVAEPAILGGLLCDKDKLRAAVLTLEAGTAQTEKSPADFERIDATRCWAGLAIMPAALAQKLADFPPDGEAVSLLLRLALQSRVETVPLQLEEPSDTRWVLANDTHALAQREEALLDQAVPASIWSGPLTALAGKLVRLGAPKGLENGGILSGGAALSLSLVAPVLIALGHTASGLSMVALGAFVGAFSVITAKMKSVIFGYQRGGIFSRYLNASLDILAVISLGLAMPREPLILVAMPILIVGMLRLAAQASGGRVAPFWNDRALQLAALAICTVYGVLSEGLLILGLLALAQCLWRSRAEPD